VVNEHPQLAFFLFEKLAFQKTETGLLSGKPLSQLASVDKLASCPDS